MTVIRVPLLHMKEDRYYCHQSPSVIQEDSYDCDQSPAFTQEGRQV